MSDREEQTRSFRTSTFSALPLSAVTAAMAQNLAGAPAAGISPEEDARNRIATLEREARALGNDPQAALLFHEAGLLWEDPLRNPRNAAVAFQAAYRIAPTFLANVRAARRLFADVGNWQMVLQLLEAELGSTQDDRARAGLLLDKAQILEDRLSREAEARTTLLQCLQLEPRDTAILTQLESVFSAHGDHASLVKVQRLLAATLDDSLLRAQALTTAGLILEDRLQRPEEAAALFHEAFALDRTDPLLLSAVKRVSGRDGRNEALVAALQAEAGRLGARGAPAYLELAKVHERAGRDAEALEALLSARRVSPSEPLILSELATIYERAGRHEDLADVLHAWLGTITDEGELVAINLRLAALYEEELKRESAAIAPYEAILARIPGHSGALAGLGKLYHRMQNWEGLLAVYDAEIDASSDIRTKATRVFRAAEVLEEHLGREDDAVLRFNECLRMQPGFLPAQKALSRLYEKQGRYADLVSMFEQDLLQTTDREQLIATLNKIASLHEERLNALDPAIDCMRRILDLAPDHQATLLNLARLLERAARWAELIEVHELQANYTNDTKQILSLHHRNAELLDEQLEDRAGATAAYERLLQLSPSYLPALKALGRLYAQEKRWTDLVRMYRAEAEISASTEHAASLIHKIGELFEHRIRDLDQAIASYREVLTLSPSHYPALRALARIYQSLGSWESLIEVLRSEAVSRTNPADRANAMFQAAAIWEDRLGRADLAIDGYQEVLRLTPGHTAALRALDRIHAARDDVKELIAVLDRETQTAPDVGSKVSAYVRLARIYLDRLNEPARAAQCCEAILALDAGSVMALRTLARIRAADRARRGELRLRLADQVDDPKLKHALRLAASVDQERTAPEVVLERLEAAFEADPEDSRVAFALERALRHTGDYRGLRSFYARRLSQGAESTERVSLLLRMAELSEAKLGEPEEARDAFARALEVQPNLLPALQGMRRTSLLIGDLAAAREHWEAEAGAARDAKGALEAFTGAARTAKVLADEKGAIALFRKALDIDPLDPAATTGLEDLLAQRGGAEDLAALYERRGEARLLQREHEAAAEAFHAAAGAIVNLEDPERALKVLERALAAQPTHAPSLELKAELCLQQESWSEAGTALQLRIQEGGEPATLARLHLVLGGLFQDRLGDPTRAAAHLQTVLTMDGENVEALERLATLNGASGNWTGAADCLKRLLALLPGNADQAKHLVSLARVVEEGFGDVPQAASLYRQALEKVPGDGALIDRLVELYERTGNVEELVQMLEAQVAAATELGRANALRLKIGELYTRALPVPEKAIAVYRQVLEGEPASLPARIPLAELLERDPASHLMAVEEHRTILRQDLTRVESLHALFRLWLGLKQNDRAFSAAALLFLFRAADEQESAFYNELKNRQLPEPTGAIALLDVDTHLLHPAARGPLVDVLRVIGDQLTKVYPPGLEAAGIDKRADRLRNDHAIHRAVRSVAQIFGVDEFDVYQARRGTVFLETTDPLGVCVGQEVARKFNAREQKFLIGRAVMGLVNKSAVLSKLSLGESADLLGNAVRMHVPDFDGLGRPDEEQTKQLRRAASRKAVKQLELPAQALDGVGPIQLAPILDGLQSSADRTGLLLCGDLQVAMNLVLREDPSFSVSRIADRDPLLKALEERADLRELMTFGLSEEYFRLRQRLGLAV